MTIQDSDKIADIIFIFDIENNVSRSIKQLSHIP